MLPLTEEEYNEYAAARHCKWCKAEFTDDSEYPVIRVHHHNHLNGKYVAPL